jgi:hypothetical protein
VRLYGFGDEALSRCLRCLAHGCPKHAELGSQAVGKIRRTHYPTVRRHGAKPRYSRWSVIYLVGVGSTKPHHTIEVRFILSTAWQPNPHQGRACMRHGHCRLCGWEALASLACALTAYPFATSTLGDAAEYGRLFRTNVRRPRWCSDFVRLHLDLQRHGRAGSHRPILGVENC